MMTQHALAYSPGDLEPFAQGVLIPTMGALHEGHLTLIRLARRRAEMTTPALPVVVSVFVNPTQFDERADFERYPRALERDAELAHSAGADCVFAPPVDVVYPACVQIASGPIPACAAGRGLEDHFRRGHFAGVCQVVRRLFELTRCRAAVFGEKDWQQLQTVRAMSRDERLGVEIIPGPTIREADGLAMSSRNVHLSGEERLVARTLSRSLLAAGAAPTIEEAERVMRTMLVEAGITVNYACVRHAETLERLTPTLRADDLDIPGRALVAGRLGVIRLLDNMPWPGRRAERPGTTE